MLCENGRISVLVPSSASIWACQFRREPAGLVARLTAFPADLSDKESGSAQTAQVRWALLADPHIAADLATYPRGSSPAEHLREAVEQILNAGPEAAWIAGDLAWNAGLPADYARLRALLEPLSARMPLCLMLGNHDNRAAFLAEFGAGQEQAHPAGIGLLSGANPEPAAAKALAVVEHGPIRWILLDSLLRTDIVPGLLGKAQRGWLRGLLETTDARPTLIVVHHPLDEDDDSLLDGDRLLRLIEPFPQVKAIFTAHDHAFHIDSGHRVHRVSLPALGMPFDPLEAVGWVEASLSATRGVFTFHAVGNQAVGRNEAREGATTTLIWR